MPRIYPIDSVADVGGAITFTGRATPDKWQPQESAPIAGWRRAAAYSLAALAAVTVLGDVPRAEAASVDRTHAPIERPRFETKRHQHLYPFEFRGDVSRKESVSIDRFHPPVEQPRFDIRREQWKYPSEFRGDIPRAESVSLDRWHPNVERPVFDAKRQQAVYPAEFRGDVPRAEKVSVDRWHSPLETPRVEAKRQHAYPVEFRPQVVSAAAPTVNPDSWHPQIEQPAFRRAAAIQQAEVRGDAPRLERVSADKWHPEIARPRFDLIRTQAVYPALSFHPLPLASPIFAERWHPLVAQPLFERQRSHWIYPAEFRGDVPRLERVSSDRWQPDTARPIFNVRRSQAIYPASSFDPKPLASSPLFIDRWHLLIEQPVFDVRRAQQRYPVEFRGDVPRVERVSIDRWATSDALPLTGKRQPLAPSEFRADPPLLVSASVDRWHPSWDRPATSAAQRLYPGGGEVLFVVARVPDPGWMPGLDQPLFAIRRGAWIHSILWGPLDDVAVVITPDAPDDRTFAIAAESRMFTPANEPRGFTVSAEKKGAYRMSYAVIKDPNADLDYAFDWSQWLGADTIASSTWAAPASSGITTHDASVDVDARKTTVWLRSGNRGLWSVTNHITTVGGQADQRSLQVSIQPR